MTTFATLNDLLEVEPTIQEYGLLDWSQELTSATTEVIRHIRVRWWPSYSNRTRVDISYAGNIGGQMDPDKLDPTQWTKAAVYYCIAHQICPKLTKFDVQGDRFQIMMDYYAKRYETEMDLTIRNGVWYDTDNNETYSDAEKEATKSLRLQR